MHLKVNKRQSGDRQRFQISLTRSSPRHSSSPLTCPDNPDTVESHRLAILGRDYPGIRFQLLVEPGEHVSEGQAVLCDRHRPEIRFPSPASGLIEEVNRGARRALDTLVIGTSDHEQATPVIIHDPGLPIDRGALLDSGAWSAFKTRPFGHIPDPHAAPAAIFVTAIDTRPGAIDPVSVVQYQPDLFRAGMVALERVFSAPIYVCTGTGHGDTVAALVAPTVNCVEVSGGHPAGLPSTHIQALYPVGGYQGNPNNMAWHIDCQDVISIGHLAEFGRCWFNRVVALDGKPVSLITGSLVDHGGGTQYLSAFCRQVSRLSTRTHPTKAFRYRSLLPTPNLDRLAPPGILAVPLMRALLIGDADQVRALGGLELIEEDLESLSVASSTGADYGMLLRGVLEQLHGEMHA